MRQIQLDAVGPPDVLHVVEVDPPVPGPGEVLVRADAAATTFIETQVRAGRSMRPDAEPLALPARLGNGVEGTITAVGAGVGESMVGTRVVTATGGMGGYAEQVVVPAGDPVPVPAGLATGEAAALLADGRTALGLVRAAQPVPTDRVVITAAGALVDALDRAASGSLRVTIGQRFPLDQAAQAHAAIESRRTIGKALLIA